MCVGGNGHAQETSMPRQSHIVEVVHRRIFPLNGRAFESPQMREGASMEKPTHKS